MMISTTLTKIIEKSTTETNMMAMMTMSINTAVANNTVGDSVVTGIILMAQQTVVVG